MNKKDAIRAMLDGKKVYHISWETQSSFQYFDETELQFRIESSTPVLTGLATGWEIYEEAPEQKTVTIEKWLVYNGDLDTHSVSEGDSDYIQGLAPYFKLVKLLDSYEVTL